MSDYTKKERIEMLLIYGESGRSSSEARRLYSQRYPEKRLPSRAAFERLVKKFHETGSVSSNKKNRPRLQTNEAAEVAVLAAVSHNPHISSRQIQKDSGISKTSILRILKRHSFHPYHISLHQELHGNDYVNRLEFSQWALQQLEVDEFFFNKMLFTDESTFTNHGQLNKRNMHYWSVENPMWLRQVERQRPWSCNVWCGILQNRIIGPFFIEGTLNGQKYADFLLQQLPQLLEEVPLDTRLQMWYQHDGCPAHNARVARAVLHELFPERWIGRGGHINWPARSPDLNPLDFFVWGTLKNIVYNDVPTTQENMKERILAACANINSESLERARESFKYRLQKCIEVRGRHFEHLLK